MAVIATSAPTDSNTSIVLRDVDDLPNVSAVETALNETNAVAREVEQRLDGLLSRASSTAATRGVALASVAQTAAAVADDASELTNVLDSASRAVEAVSARVRFLDSLLSVGNAALARVEHVLTLRVCAEGAKASLSANDLSTAATHVHKYLELDANVRADPSSLAAVEQMNQSIAELTRKVREKASIVADNVAENEVLPIPSLITAMKLFVPIGLKSEGVSRFSEVLCGRILVDSDLDIRSLLLDSAKHTSEMKSGGTVDATEGNAADMQPHLAALSSLYEIVAAYLHQSEALVADAFGPDAYISISLDAQKQCDSQSDKVLIRYAEFRSLDEVTRAIRSENASARDLDPLLNELNTISQRTSAYFNFIISRCTTVIEAAADPQQSVSDGTHRQSSESFKEPAFASSPSPSHEIGSKTVTTNGHKFSSAEGNIADHALDMDDDQQESIVLLKKKLSESKLASWATDLFKRYVSFEAYFMRQNARKAIRIDEVSQDMPLTSTAVDDFFFVLQKVVNRALMYGGSVNAVLSILQHINTCVANELLPYIRRRLRETEELFEKALVQNNSSISLPSAALTVSYITELAKANMPSTSSLAEDKTGVGMFSFSGSSAASAGDNDLAKYDIFVALNNASVSAEYAVRFQSNLEQSALKVCDSHDEQSRLSLALSQLSETSRSLLLASEQGLTQLSKILTGRIAGSTDKLLSEASYVVSDTTFDDNLSSSLSDLLLQDVEARVLPKSIEERLTEANWDALVRHVADWTANVVEAKIFLPASNRSGGKRFNALGGLRADRDVRGLSAYYAGKCKRSSVRDVFTRLSQIAMLVNLERPAEVYDIWGVNSGGMTWRLSPTEARRALLLRIDFKEDVVKALRL